MLRASLLLLELRSVYPTAFDPKQMITYFCSNISSSPISEKEYSSEVYTNEYLVQIVPHHLVGNMMMCHLHTLSTWVDRLTTVLEFELSVPIRGVDKYPQFTLSHRCLRVAQGYCYLYSA